MTTTAVSTPLRSAIRLVEVYLRTGIAAFLASLALSGLNVTQIADLSQAKKIAIAALAAAIQAVVSAVALAAGREGSTSLLPAAYDPATPPVHVSEQ